MFLHFKCTVVHSHRSCCRGPKKPRTGAPSFHKTAQVPYLVPVTRFTEHHKLGYRSGEKTQPHSVCELTGSNQTDKQKCSPVWRLFLGPLPLVRPFPEAVPPVWSHLRTGDRIWLLPKTVQLKTTQLHLLG